MLSGGEREREGFSDRERGSDLVALGFFSEGIEKVSECENPNFLIIVLVPVVLSFEENGEFDLVYDDDDDDDDVVCV